MPRSFKSLSKKQKRLAIIKDVLARVKAKQFRPQHGRYVLINLEKNEVGSQLQEIVKSGKECQVCAWGGAMLSLIAFENDFVVSDGFYWSDGIRSSSSEGWQEINDRLKEYFSASQLYLIETAFECDWSVSQNRWQAESAEVTQNDADAAEAFGKRYMHDRARLIAIFENMLKNDGIFILPPKPKRGKLKKVDR